MATTLTPAQILDTIQTQQRDSPLTILHHADALLSQSQTQTDTDAGVTPASLAADLAHYRDLFSKLRFSYLEQVTKEKYLRGIVGEPPLIATAEDNAALEERVGGMKTELQSKKRGVEALVTEMEGLSREVAGLHETVDQRVEELEVVPGEVDALEKEVEELRALVKEREGEEIEDPRMGLSLQETEELLTEARKRDAELKRMIERAQGDLPGRIRECEDVEKELEELERRRNEVTRAAKEARRLKEEGGRDLLEEQGRWYQSSEAVMNRLLGLGT